MRRRAGSVRRDANDALARYWALAALLALWELSGRLGWVDQAFMPSLSATLVAVFEMWERTHLFMHVMVSLARVTAGLLAAALIGVPSAYLLGRVFPGVAERVEALLRVFALINPYCVFPLFVVFFGAGEVAKVAVLAWVSLWPIFFGTLSGTRAVDPNLVRTARSMTAGHLAVFRKVVLPAASPSIFNGMRIGVEMSFFILIAAEMTGATAGLGWIVHSAGALNQVPRIYGAGLCIVALGVLLNRSLLFFRDGLFFWKPGTDPLTGARTGGGSRRIGPRGAAVAAAVFAAVMAVGAYEIWRAEIMLNDPGEIPEYRVWTE
ncbi:MAG: ABC transporter permease [Deltaproteobacteria bacterium]|jgi:NitT/TauT family transport system permease protein|nr:ABC transporter permease [Deltaproteobacteria bacterium]